MFEIIENLRQKPDGTKKRIAFLTSFFFSGLILVVWLSVIYPDFRQTQKKVEEVSKNSPSPISTFGDTVAEGFSKVGSEWGRMKEAMSAFSAGSTYYTATSSTSVSPTNLTEGVATTTSE